MLTFKNVSTGYKKPLLENISGEIQPGSIHFLVGKNGSGKTTFLKTLSGILTPLAGDINSDRVVFLPTDMPIQFGLTGEDLFDLYCVRSSKWFSQAILDALEVLPLLKKTIAELSSGERQRVLLGATLLHEANIVLLDEPLNHLDWDFEKTLKNILVKLASRGRSFLIASHDLNWCKSFENSTTWVLFKKQIYLQGSTTDVFGDIKLREVFKNILPEVQIKNR